MNTHNLVYVPIEPLKERYTESWYNNFPPLFEAAGFNVTIVDGTPLEQEVKVGTFLDINSTTHYKWSQLQKISQMFHKGMIAPGTVFFFGDLEFWGIEGVRLLADMNNVDVKLAAFLHAGSYTREDAFEIAEPYQRFTEVGWLAAMDKVFVGSRYHYNVFLERRVFPLDGLYLGNRIHVTKNPLFLSDYEGYNTLGVKNAKKKKMLLTNRFDPEKRPQQTLQLFQDLKVEFPDWEFVVTTGRSVLRGDPKHVAYARMLEDSGVITIKANLSKAEYHKELADAAVVVTHSIEENYGYCIAEALLYGCVPLMRNGLSHVEFSRDPRLLFNTTAESYSKARELCKTFGTSEFPEVPDLDTSGAANIVHQLKELTK